MASKKRRDTKPFTVEPGREIYLNGEPFISIHREGSTKPVEADDVTHFIAEALNKEWGY